MVPHHAGVGHESAEEVDNKGESCVVSPTFSGRQRMSYHWSHWGEEGGGEGGRREGEREEKGRGEKE